jgi:hypothetical protein
VGASEAFVASGSHPVNELAAVDGDEGLVVVEEGAVTMQFAFCNSGIKPSQSFEEAFELDLEAGKTNEGTGNFCDGRVSPVFGFNMN